MQYLYLIIFVFFILLNVVIGLASSRSKKRKAAVDSESAQSSDAEYIDAADQERQRLAAQGLAQQGVSDHEPELETQSAGNIMESFFVVEEEKAALPGGERRPAAVSVTSERGMTGEVVAAAAARMKPDTPGAQPTETLKRSDIRDDRPAPMVDMDRPSEKVTLSIEKNLLASEVAERRRAQDEKFRSYDLYEYQDVETEAWENVNKLPPLKRAIILSEILGSPKALSEGGQSQ
jgi:hypothetical protein